MTVQVAKNKSLLGAIVGDKVVFNELGQKVDAYWRGLPAKYPELELFDYVVMPNHIHALLRILWRDTNREHHLGFLMSRFKGGTSYIYGKMCREGSLVGVGSSLWQRDYCNDFLVDGNYPFYTGKEVYTSLSAIGGVMFRLTDPIALRIGVGYGIRTTAYEMTDGKYVKNTDVSTSGVEVSVGAHYRFGKFVVSLDFVTTNFKYYEAKLGFGMGY